MPAPNANSRNLCYEARDKYYGCKDKNPDNSEVCEEFRKMFEKSCLPSWVSKIRLPPGTSWEGACSGHGISPL